MINIQYFSKVSYIYIHTQLYSRLIIIIIIIIIIGNLEMY